MPAGFLIHTTRSNIIFHLVLNINQILFCSERQSGLKFYVIYIVCNTNQNKLSAASAKDKNQYGISSCSVIYPTNNSTNIWHLSGELIGWVSSRRPSNGA